MGEQQIPQINLGLNLSRCWVALRPSVLSAARIWPSVSRYLEISFGLRGSSPRLLPTLGVLIHHPVPEGNADEAVGIFGNAGRVWATALRLNPPKKAFCHTYPLGGAVIKYRISISLLSQQYETYYFFYVTLSFLCNIICYLISVFVFSLVTLSGAAAHIFVGYVSPNLFLCKLSVLFFKNQFRIITQFNCQKHFYFKLFTFFKQFKFSRFSLT